MLRIFWKRLTTISHSVRKNFWKDVIGLYYISRRIDACYFSLHARRDADSVGARFDKMHTAAKKRRYCIRKRRNRLLVLGHVTNAISEWFVKHCEVLHSNSKGPSSRWSVLPVATAFWFATRRTSLKRKFALSTSKQASLTIDLSSRACYYFSTSHLDRINMNGAEAEARSRASPINSLRLSRRRRHRVLIYWK